MDRRPNNRPDICHHCGGPVPAEAGFLNGRVDGRWTVVHADGACLAEPVERPAYRTNAHPGNCVRCGGRIDAGEGKLDKSDDGRRWVVEHVGDCPVADPTRPTAPAGKRQPYPPTAEQAAAIAQVATRQNVTIQAGAGAGKTSLLLFLAEWMEANGLTGAYRAFNNQIVADTAGKMLGNVNCATMHADALAALPHYRARLNSTNNRQSGAEQAALLGIQAQVIYVDDERKRLAAGWIAARVMRAVRKYCLSADDDISRHHIDYIDGIDPHDPATGQRTYANNDRLADYMMPFVRMAWIDLIASRGDLRFTHDVYLKVWSLGDPDIAGDIIMIDEGQDTDSVQMVVFRKLAAKGKQIVVVGDEAQVIYEWRGAVDALAEFERDGATVCWLTQSFRFGDAVAEVANGLLERLNARLRLRGHGPVASTVGPVPEPDAILCRTNAGTIRVLIEQAALGRSAALYGRNGEIVSFMKGALRLQAGQSTTNPELACFDSWAAVQAYVEEEPEGEDIKLLVKLVDEFGAQRILDNIENQPRPDEADVVISTVHKTKGLEWPRVKLHSDFRAPADGGELSPSELRTAYVACTRAALALDIEDTPHLAVGWTPAA